jgi:hypothetical protein
MEHKELRQQLQELTDAVTREPDNPLPYFLRADARILVGDFKGAYEDQLAFLKLVEDPLEGMDAETLRQLEATLEVGRAELGRLALMEEPGRAEAARVDEILPIMLRVAPLKCRTGRDLQAAHKQLLDWRTEIRRKAGLGG